MPDFVALDALVGQTAATAPDRIAAIDAGALKAWTNGRVGKTQRLADVVIVDTLPRSAIGKVLKRELRDPRLAQQGSAAKTQTSS